MDKRTTIILSILMVTFSITWLRVSSLPYLESTSKHKAIVATTRFVHETSTDFLASSTILHRMGDYSDTDNITALGMHVRESFVFVADTSGTVRRFKLDGTKNPKKERIVKGKGSSVNITNGISQLSVDWLNDKLYLVADYKILRCDLDGNNLESVLTGFREEPINVAVDPMNGFLYWSLSADVHPGLFKIDLDLLDRKKHSLPKSYLDATQILNDPRFFNIFTIDYPKNTLYFPRKTREGKIVISETTSDGKNIHDIRVDDDIETSLFKEFKGLLYFNGTFFWTNGREFFKEEYNSHVKKYYHNEFFFTAVSNEHDLVSIVILHELLQPIPVPLVTVEKLDAVFGETSAKAFWEKPRPLPGRGDGSWSGWKYELSIRNSSSEVETLQDNLRDITTKIALLSPDTEYIIKVRPYSDTGKGTWSLPFRGKTSKKTFHVPRPFGEAPSVPEILTPTIESSPLIQWSKSDGNGAERVTYELQIMDGSIDGEWTLVYNGSLTFWAIRDLLMDTSYRVRVRAVSRFGASNYSTREVTFINPKPVTVGKMSNEFIPLITAVCLMIALVIAFFYARSVNKKNDENGSVGGIKRRLDDLVPLPELPHHPHQHNILYMNGCNGDQDLSTIPKVSGSQITRTKELGEGAFGKVFEGHVQGLWASNSPPLRVAIKTLQEGASEQEKIDFLKEAKLMGNFNHPHILKLLAVCLDTSPNSLILELMEGGDLLNYLRSNRPTEKTCSLLTMNDLISICVDVAKGCKYLEDMHFVHRDLAARNCLVSTIENKQRIVKIGDFGLARDVYKSDYYRKDGQAKVPVRWMAPESLIDGVFTTQSDVWSFGVLLWEVVTMGERPYPGHSNHSVMNHVKLGGIPGQPECCPEELYSLMKLCWQKDPDKRPSFAMCLQRLEDMKDSIEFTSQFISRIQNHAYIRQFISSRSCDQSCSQNDRVSTMTESTCFTADTASFDRRTVGSTCDEGSKAYYNQRPISSPNETKHFDSCSSTPKYLEVIPNQNHHHHELQSEQLCDRDGYELPIESLPKARPRIINNTHSSIYDKPNNVVRIEIKADVIASLNEHDDDSERSENRMSENRMSENRMSENRMSENEKSSSHEEGNLSPPPTYSQVFSDNFPPDGSVNFDSESRDHESESESHHSNHHSAQSQLHPLTCSSSSSDGSLHYQHNQQKQSNHSKNPHLLECNGTKEHRNRNANDDELADDENDQHEKENKAEEDDDEKGDNTHESVALRTNTTSAVVGRVPRSEGRIEVVLGRGATASNLPTLDSGVSILRSSLNSCIKNPCRSNRDILQLGSGREGSERRDERKSSQSMPELDCEYKEEEDGELNDWVFPLDTNSNDTKSSSRLSESKLRDRHYYVNGYKVPLNRVIKICNNNFNDLPQINSH